MPKINGMYERSRDNYHQPTYWRVENNGCPPHFHSSIELAYLQSGEMEILVDGVFHTAKEKELVVIPPYSVHRFHTPAASENYVLIIPQDYIRSFRLQTRGKRFSQILLPDGAPAREIAHSMRLLLGQPAQTDPSPQAGLDSYILRGQIYTILGLLLQELPLQEIAPGESNVLVRNILSYLHSNYRHPLPLAQIASHYGYSRSRISHIFNKEVGCRIPEYIGSLRARAAASMLLEENIPITAIALESGFESMRTFYRVFKDCYGVTPSQLVQLPAAERLRLLQTTSLAENE